MSAKGLGALSKIFSGIHSLLQSCIFDGCSSLLPRKAEKNPVSVSNHSKLPNIFQSYFVVCYLAFSFGVSFIHFGYNFICLQYVTLNAGVAFCNVLRIYSGVFQCAFNIPPSTPPLRVLLSLDLTCFKHCQFSSSAWFVIVAHQHTSVHNFRYAKIFIFLNFDLHSQTSISGLLDARCFKYSSYNLWVFLSLLRIAARVVSLNFLDCELYFYLQYAVLHRCRLIVKFSEHIGILHTCFA